ncbi:MAG: hypothetical protein M1308_08020 [Actinobacteria bacterium]|nr:hypothetical protein [Actinomycetota bacterium]
MNYLQTETLEFFIYLLYKNFGVCLDVCNSKKIDAVIKDIIDNNLEDIFLFGGFVNLPAQSDCYDELFKLIEMTKRKLEDIPESENYKIIFKTLELIRYHEYVRDPIKFKDFKIFHQWMWSPRIYGLLTLCCSEKEKLLLFLKEYINLFSTDKLIKTSKNFYNFDVNIEKITQIFNNYLNIFSSTINPTLVIEPYDNKGNPIEREFRLYDSILYYLFNDSISINDCNFEEFNGEEKLIINITIKKSLPGISTIENTQFPIKPKEPIEVKVVEIPPVEIKNLNENKIIKNKDEEIIPLDISEGTRWENITIRFIDGENVEISIGSQKWKKNYKDMGFQNNRTVKPDKQWELLIDLSDNKGEISWWKGNKADWKKKKQKQLLSDTLKAYFQIKESPFYDYKKEKAYKIKINLIPQ